MFQIEWFDLSKVLTETKAGIFVNSGFGLFKEKRKRGIYILFAPADVPRNLPERNHDPNTN